MALGSSQYHLLASSVRSLQGNLRLRPWCIDKATGEVNTSRLRDKVWDFPVMTERTKRDFAQKAKSRGGTLVLTCAYIRESSYSWIIAPAGISPRGAKYTVVSMPEKISIFLNRGREESVGNDDVSIVWRKDRKSRRDRSGRFCDIDCAVIIRYSFALKVIRDILGSRCFESYGPKDTR